MVCHEMMEEDNIRNNFSIIDVKKLHLVQLMNLFSTFLQATSIWSEEESILKDLMQLVAIGLHRWYINGKRHYPNAEFEVACLFVYVFCPHLPESFFKS